MPGRPRRTAFRSLAFRISAAVLVLMGAGGVTLYAVVHRALAGFVADTVRLDMEWRARQVYGLCERSLDELARSGGLAIPSRVRVAKGLTLGRIEDFLREEGVSGLVYGDDPTDPLVDVGMGKARGSAPWAGVPLFQVAELVLQGRRVYIYRVDYEPWGWHVVLASDVGNYLGVFTRVRGVYLEVAAGVTVLGALFGLVLARWLRRPVREIVADLEAGRPPRYRGVSEFEYVAERIRATMIAEREQAADIERLLAGTGARLALLDEAGRILRANRRFLSAAGLREDEAVGRSPAEILPGLGPECRRLLASPPAEADAFECEERPGQTDPAWVLWSRSPVPGVGAPKWVLTGIDITDRRRAEADRRRLMVAVEQAAEVLLVADRRWVVQYANPAVEAVTGFSPDEVVGSPARLLNRSDDADRIEAEVAEAFRAGRSWSGRTRNRRKDGTSYAAELGASPVRAPDGTLVGAVGMIRDVTREVELERQLHQAQKLDALGVLSGGIAHDFNNLLVPIMGYAEMGLSQLPAGHPVHRGLRKVLAAAGRARDLVRQILAFSSPSGGSHRPLRAGPCVEEAAVLVRASLPAGIDLVVSGNGGNAVVRSEPGQIEQVVVNLCTNAAHALGEGPGEIRVFLDAVDVEDVLGLAAGRYLRIAVEDDGPGIPVELVDRVFEPFFTTKEPGQGTGLGLAVVHGIARSHGGGVRVVPRRGGARLEVYLPLADEAPARAPAAAAAPPGKTGHRILVVEDDPVVAELLEAGLAGQGFRVVVAVDGRDALGRFEADPDRFDAVVTDYSMPGLTGDELARRVHALRPALPIVLCSGFAHPLGERAPEDLGFDAFLPKPLRLADLVSVLTGILEGRKE